MPLGRSARWEAIIVQFYLVLQSWASLVDYRRVTELDGGSSVPLSSAPPLLVPIDPVFLLGLAEVIASADDAIYSETSEGVVTSWESGGRAEPLPTAWHT